MSVRSGALWIPPSQASGPGYHGSVGAVAEMLRKRERRDARKRGSWWDLLWIPVCPAFVYAGAFAIPETESRWLSALLWAGYGLLVMGAVFVAEKVVRRIRRRPALVPAWRVGYPLRVVVFMTVFCVVGHLIPRGSTPERGLLWAGTTGAITGLVLTLIDRVVARRAPAP